MKVMKIIAMTLFVLGALVAAQAQSLKAQVEASNKRIHAAMMKKDLTGLEKLFKAGMTKDFKYVEGGKTMTYDEMVAGMKMGIGSLKKVTVASTKIIAVKEKGNAATITCEHSMGGVTAGPDKKDHTNVFTGMAVESYVKVGGKWLMSKMEWKNSKMTMDGKPMAMPGG